MSLSPVRVDGLVVGGGAAGLFTLDALVRSGRNALLVESRALGTGQTTSSQGILHAGVKYSLAGVAGDDAEEAAAAAAEWRRILEGSGQPALAGLRVLTDHEFLWRTAGLKGAAGMLGARLALQTRPEAVPDALRPAWLAGVRGDVYRLGETVIDPRDLLGRLAALHPRRIALGDVEAIRHGSSRVTVEVRLGQDRCTVEAGVLFLAAGEGNEGLLRLAGEQEPMQRRPLRQAMVRGDLPLVFGHCIDGARTRITVTSDHVPGGVVWHVGGELAERGPDVAEDVFLGRARREISECIPAVDLARAEFSSYLVQRAEPRTPSGRRPPAGHVRRSGRIVTLWPVKLVMAPHAASRALAVADAPEPGDDGSWPLSAPRPGLASRPWEGGRWTTLP